jgi:soluble cytochrome b562
MSKLEEPEVIARVRDYRQAFGTQAGRRVLADLRKSFSRRSSFVPNDPYATSFREGERSVVLKIESMLKLTEAELDRWTEDIRQQSQPEVEAYDA